LKASKIKEIKPEKRKRKNIEENSFMSSLKVLRERIKSIEEIE